MKQFCQFSQNRVIYIFPFQPEIGTDIINDLLLIRLIIVQGKAEVIQSCLCQSFQNDL